MRWAIAALALIAAPVAAQDVSYSPIDPSAYMQVATANASIATLQAADRIFLTDVILAQTAAVAIGLGPRTLTVSTNCVVGDRMYMTPAAAMPAGYMLGDIFCSANGTAQATLYAPLLAIGANYSITARVTAFR